MFLYMFYGFYDGMSHYLLSSPGNSFTVESKNTDWIAAAWQTVVYVRTISESIFQSLNRNRVVRHNPELKAPLYMFTDSPSYAQSEEHAKTSSGIV